MIRALRLVSAVLLLFLPLSCAKALPPVSDNTYHHPPMAKNVIILIGDGCGYNHMAAADLYMYGNAWVQPFVNFPFRAGVSTFPSGGSYNPEKAWSDFQYLKANPTDSAAAATAIACGVKTYNTAIGMDAEKKRVRNVVEAAEALHKSTGVVTTVPLCHATPACFVAHNEERDRYSKLAQEMISKSEVDVIMGTGHPLFNNDGQEAFNKDTDKDKKPDAHEYMYVGGEAQWNEILAGKAGAAVDADHNGIADDAWKLIQTRAEFQALEQGPAPKRVLGIPQVFYNTQQARSGDTKAAPFAVPRLQSVPTLEEMTRGALNVLDDNPNGFFLMVEGGAIDMAAHSNQPGRMVEEVLDFDNAIAAVIAWVNASPRPWETLVIVTADHETGYLTRERSTPEEVVWAWQPLESKGPGNLPAMTFNSKNHTNSLVPIFATGDAARAFDPCVIGNDPHRKGYIDNTDIAKVVFQVMK